MGLPHYANLHRAFSSHALLTHGSNPPLFGLGTVSILISVPRPPVDRETDVRLLNRQTDELVCIRASMPVQWFLAYRIKILSHSWIVFGGICMLSLAQGGCGFAGGILATIISKCVERPFANARPPEAHTVTLP